MMEPPEDPEEDPDGKKQTSTPNTITSIEKTTFPHPKSLALENGNGHLQESNDTRV